MKQGARVTILRYNVAHRPAKSDPGTTYQGTVVKSNGSTIAVQCDNNGPRVWVRRERVWVTDTSPAPETPSAGCTQAVEASD